MTKIISWDLEIRDPVSDTEGGWDAARNGNCGISALVLFDSETDRYHIYGSDTLDEAVDHLNSADLLVGYNTLNFDCNVLFGVTGRYITVPQYDILAEIWNELGVRRKGYKLDQVAQATIGIGKSGNGEFATALVAQNRWAELFDYCLGDVHLVRKLYDHIVDCGFIKGADGERLTLNKPVYPDYA